MKNPAAKAVPIIQHPDIRRKLLTMKAYVEGLRALNYFTAFCMDMALVSEDRQEKERWNGFVELLTPVCKAYSSEKGLDVCSLAIDIYGGYGYCTEYPVEQYLRDCRIAPIYEGTNGIQALDLVGRKLSQRKGANVMNLFGEVAATIALAKNTADLDKYAPFLEEANNALIDLTMYFAEMGKSAGFLIPILNASPYLELFGDVVIGHLLLKSAGIASARLTEIYGVAGAEDSVARKRALVHENPEVAFYQGKFASAQFFAVDVLTSVKARCEAIKIGGKIPIEIAEESFGG